MRRGLRPCDYAAWWAGCGWVEGFAGSGDDLRVDSRVFVEGSTAVRRDVLNGQVWSAAPYRVLGDQGGRLVLACWPGIASLAPTTWIEWLRSGDDVVRKQGIGNLASGRWELGRWVWRETAVLSWFGFDADFSVHRFFPITGQSPRWYVNFERPPRRTAIGIDTFDLMLDLVVDPELDRWAWKDEDEYTHARRLGLVTDADHDRVEQARRRAVTLIETRGGPFAEDWAGWQPSAGWPTPVLPPEALTAFPGAATAGP